MFETFGMKDIWTATKRYKYWVLLALVLCLLAGAAYGYQDAKSVPITTSEKAVKDVYRAYSTFGVDTDLENASAVTLQTGLYVKLLKTDPCRNYVADQINQKYTPDQLFNLMPIEDPKGQPVTAANLLQDVKVRELQGTASFAIITDTFDKQLSNDINTAFKNYLENELPDDINDASAVFLDTTESLIKAGGKTTTAKEEEELYGANPITAAATESTQTAVSTKSNMIQFGMIGVIVGIVIAFIALLAIALLRPTLNRKSDFAKYDIPVISEIGKIGTIRR